MELGDYGMDLGIKGKTALVCASSKGLGLGCARALAGAGVNLVMNARGADALEASAAAIRADFGVEVTAVAADITSEDGRARVLSAAKDVDILVTNAGGPPPGMWSDWEREDFIKALDSNMLTPIALMKALLPGMMERGWGRVVNITSQSVKAPIPQLGLSNAARTGLTGYVAGTSRQVAYAGSRRFAGRRRGQGAGHHAGTGARKPLCHDSGAPLWHKRGIRRGLRVPVFGSRRLYCRAEHPS
jgi:3-oxoacyl-[acyl-carrier protein] reductase